jgi:hypothetical protein
MDKGSQIDDITVCAQEPDGSVMEDGFLIRLLKGAECRRELHISRVQFLREV